MKPVTCQMHLSKQITQILVFHRGGTLVQCDPSATDTVDSSGGSPVVTVRQTAEHQTSDSEDADEGRTC